MNPKERANKIFTEFETMLLNTDYMVSGFVIPLMAKQFSLHVVNKLIAEEEMWKNGEPNPEYYWPQVKKEIQKL